MVVNCQTAEKCGSVNSVSTFSQLLSNTPMIILCICGSAVRLCVCVCDCWFRALLIVFPVITKAAASVRQRKEAILTQSPMRALMFSFGVWGPGSWSTQGDRNLLNLFFLIHTPLYLGCVGPSLPEKTSHLQRLWLSTRVNTPLSNHNTCCPKLLMLKTDHIQMSLY